MQDCGLSLHYVYCCMYDKMYYSILLRLNWNNLLVCAQANWICLRNLIPKWKRGMLFSTCVKVKLAQIHCGGRPDDHSEGAFWLVCYQWDYISNQFSQPKGANLDVQDCVLSLQYTYCRMNDMKYYSVVIRLKWDHFLLCAQAKWICPVSPRPTWKRGMLSSPCLEVWLAHTQCVWDDPMPDLVIY